MSALEWFVLVYLGLGIGLVSWGTFLNRKTHRINWSVEGLVLLVGVVLLWWLVFGSEMVTLWRRGRKP